MTQIEKILSVAAKEIGYKEGRGNKTKYGKAYGLDGVPWCVIFQWWVFKTAGLSSLFYGGKKIASCSALKTYAQSKKQWVTSRYKSGDLVILNFPKTGCETDHIALVEKVNGNVLTTIEGNTSSGASGSQSNGDGVYRKQRNVSLVNGAYRPAYDASAANVIKKVTVSCSQVEPGSTGGHVRAVQAILNANLNAGLSTDGIYGPKTATAIEQFQSAHHLSPDGIVGKDTWAALLN